MGKAGLEDEFLKDSRNQGRQQTSTGKIKSSLNTQMSPNSYHRRDLSGFKETN